ncbi:MAG: dihydrodipicolinate synthase family protein [Chloroflexi bacterium]|nr:dihydrodipicolinate synthase family protein [Chloroflexota bacterium]MCY4111094.1 dihydrodipicolinate synthase family protein [Chloroflexota bacterium]
MTTFQSRIHGVIPALLTPLNADFTADEASLRRLTRRVVDAGCHGIVVLGTTGEFASIDDADREIVIRAAVDEVGGAVPVIVACGQPNVRRTHEQLREAGDLGADGVLVNPPFYFEMTQDELVGYFAGVVRESPVPVLLYNIPRLTGVPAEPGTLPRLRDVGVQGTKDSSGSVGNVMSYLAAVRGGPEFRVIVGGDVTFLHALISGAVATTGMTPNIAPQLNLDIYEAWRIGDLEAAAAAQNRTNEFLEVFQSRPGFAHAVAKGLLSRVGVMERWVALPKTSGDDAQIDAAFELLKPYLPEFAPAAVPA